MRGGVSRDAKTTAGRDGPHSGALPLSYFGSFFSSFRARPGPWKRISRIRSVPMRTQPSERRNAFIFPATISESSLLSCTIPLESSLNITCISFIPHHPRTTPLSPVAMNGRRARRHGLTGANQEHRRTRISAPSWRDILFPEKLHLPLSYVKIAIYMPLAIPSGERFFGGGTAWHVKNPRKALWNVGKIYIHPGNNRRRRAAPTRNDPPAAYGSTETPKLRKRQGQASAPERYLRGTIR